MFVYMYRQVLWQEEKMNKTREKPHLGIWVKYGLYYTDFHETDNTQLY